MIRGEPTNDGGIRGGIDLGSRIGQMENWSGMDVRDHVWRNGLEDDGVLVYTDIMIQALKRVMSRNRIHYVRDPRSVRQATAPAHAVAVAAAGDPSRAGDTGH